ncbi:MULTISPECIES: DUF6390 family protein [unclassified Mycobacterium]|uniref:DUF6390 family protein n=1 Tax=unclassified Mycobacterium TaxID=2642494 RepID=UPI0029C65847|nr:MULTISPECIES: DUF6390 family protein [unclassified Mycobacterium]
MGSPTERHLPPGYQEFARYAFPPNELGYCGPADTEALLRGGDSLELVARAKEFDGAWPYLDAIADAVGLPDPLTAEVVRNYWIGGPLLQAVDPVALLSRLRTSFAGQVTGLLDALEPGQALAHHSFHVFVVYPWIRFLDRNPTKPVQVMQDCRIRWGTVQSVEGDHAVIDSRPLVFVGGALGLGAPIPERVRWRKDGTSLAPAPVPGQTVSAHWGWVCGLLEDGEGDACAAATQASLDIVNAVRSRL